ncbi:cylicin-1 [Aethina tumida]|uniref:cylicin-1 n=1 Tax=Aethina tumida TaxID=116153 RepID=UPI00096B30B2|nr:cylicin-1 [Aethina tumida]
MSCFSDVQSFYIPQGFRDVKDKFNLKYNAREYLDQVVSLCTAPTTLNNYNIHFNDQEQDDNKKPKRKNSKSKEQVRSSTDDEEDGRHMITKDKLKSKATPKEKGGRRSTQDEEMVKTVERRQKSSLSDDSDDYIKSAFKSRNRASSSARSSLEDEKSSKKYNVPFHGAYNVDRESSGKNVKRRSTFDEDVTVIRTTEADASDDTIDVYTLITKEKLSEKAVPRDPTTRRSTLDEQILSLINPSRYSTDSESSGLVILSRGKLKSSSKSKAKRSSSDVKSKTLKDAQAGSSKDAEKESRKK